jgi:hypothetical protein
MASNPTILDFNKWNGEPFWSGVPKDGRTAYVSPGSGEEDFVAYGCHVPTRRTVFVVRGANDAELARFTEQMRKEGAGVVEGVPPFGGDSQSSDKPPPPPGSPTGLKPADKETL